MSRDGRRREFVFGVALPAVLIALATAAVVFLALNRMTGEFNNLDREHTTRTVAAIVATRLDLIEREAAELAASGLSAATGLPVASDPGRLTVVLDRTGRPLAADVTITPIDSADAAALVARAAATAKGSAAALVGSPSGILLAGIGRLPPVGAGLAPRYVVLGADLGGSLDEPAQQFDVAGLVWESGAAVGDTELALSSASGRPIGHLSWQPRGPGHIVYERVAGLIAAVLALLYVGMAFLVLTNWKILSTVRAGEREARHNASHDALSGLPNRLSFQQSLGALAAQTPVPVITVVYVDLDGFKEVNDTYGHEIGDRLIRAVAAGFECLVDGRGTLARLGGDEFAVAIRGYQSFAESVELGGRLIAFLADPFSIDGRTVRVGASIGIASSDEATLTGGELVRRADVAMYAAKNRGKNRIEIYAPEMDAGRAEKAELAAALRKAIASNALAIHYQPVVEAGSGRIVLVEALLRWIRPDVGPISPAVFLPIAEDEGMTDELGTWVLRRVCREARSFGDVRVAVNVFATQFKNPLFDEQLKAILDEEGFPANRLELDLNESYLVAYPDRAQRMINALHRLGIHVALDDFGTGFSSISYLRRFAFDKVKIDRSVVIDVVRDPASQQLVRSTVALADALGVDVTAEGIERRDEAEALTAAGCRELQGYYFGAPTAPAELLRRLGRPEDRRRTA